MSDYQFKKKRKTFFFKCFILVLCCSVFVPTVTSPIIVSANETLETQTEEKILIIKQSDLYQGRSLLGLTTAIISGAKLVWGSLGVVGPILAGVVAASSYHAVKEGLTNIFNHYAFIEQLPPDIVEEAELKLIQNGNGSITMSTVLNFSFMAMLSKFWIRPGINYIEEPETVESGFPRSTILNQSFLFTNLVKDVVGVNATFNVNYNRDRLRLRPEEGYVIQVKMETSNGYDMYFHNDSIVDVSAYDNTIGRIYYELDRFGSINLGYTDDGKTVSGSGFFDDNNSIYTLTGTQRLSTILEMLGIRVLTLEQYEEFISSFTALQDGKKDSKQEITVGVDTIKYSNPTLTFNGTDWVDEDGNVVALEDLVITIPDTYNPTTKVPEYSAPVQNVIINNIYPETTPDVPQFPTIDTSSILSAITSIFELIVALPEIIFNYFATTLTNIWDWCQELPDTLESIWLKAITSLVEFNTMLWNWCQELPQTLENVWFKTISNVVDTTQDILDSVLAFPKLLLDLFMELFIPEQSVVMDFTTNITSVIYEKIPIFEQIKLFFETLKWDENSSAPVIKIKIPSNFLRPKNYHGSVSYGGFETVAIDFAFFTEYRVLFLNIIRCFLWFPYLMRMFKRLPSIISMK